MPKNEDGDNKGLRLTEGRRLMVAALESEKDRARRFEQRISACTTPIPWPPGLYCSDREPREHSSHDVKPARRHAGRLNSYVLESD